MWYLVVLLIKSRSTFYRQLLSSVLCNEIMPKCTTYSSQGDFFNKIERNELVPMEIGEGGCPLHKKGGRLGYIFDLAPS